MMNKLDWNVLPSDVAILREMASRVRRMADDDHNRRLIDLWYAHDEGREHRPLILTETDGGLNMVAPDWKPRCREPWAQGQEWGLFSSILHRETIGDDFPLEPYVGVGWAVDRGTPGVETHLTQPEAGGPRGAYHIDAVLTLPDGLDKLRHRQFRVDRDKTLAVLDTLRTVYDGILDVKPRHNPWWTLGLTWETISLVGLENMMIYMYDQPEALHGLMAFLRDDYIAFVKWMEREGLLTLNNANDYCGSGSRGYTRSLPQANLPAGATPRARDLWTLIESQETVGVGPTQYGEFIFPYEAAIAREFGRVYYGCCEPVHTRWDVLQNMPNLRRVSVSPWSDEEFMAATLGRSLVYSRKPKPTLVSTERFDEEAIRRDLRTTMTLTRRHGCPTEIVMKDVHTLSGEPDRLTRWVNVAREVSRDVYGE